MSFGLNMRDEGLTSKNKEPASLKRVLVVSHTYLPSETSAALQTVSLVRKLPEAGWKPTVLTVGPRWQYLPTNKDTSDPGVEVIRTALWRPLAALERMVRMLKVPSTARPARESDSKDSRGRAHTRPRGNPATTLRGAIRALYWNLRPTDADFLFPLFALFRGLSYARKDRPLVVYSIGKPFSSLVAGHLLAKLLGLPHVVEFHDPWTLSPSYGGKGLAAWFERKLEQWTVTGARAVVAKTRTELAILRQGHPAAKAGFFTVTCGFDETTLPDPSVVREPRSTTDGIYRVVHTGSLSDRRNPVPFLEGVKALLDRSPDLGGRLKLAFAGRCGIFGGLSLSEWCDHLGLAATLHTTGWTSRSELLELMADADVLLLIPDYAGQIPAKAYEYMWFGRRILVLDEVGSESAELVKRFDRGLFAPSNEPGSIADALCTLIKGISDVPAREVGAEELASFSARGRASSVAAILNDALDT